MSTPVTQIEEKYRKTDLPDFQVGDQVAVAVLIREMGSGGRGKMEEKTRTQNFIGDVIAMQGKGIRRAFTVRRVVQGEGVERVFPLHSPLVQSVTVQRKGDVRRAKLYDLRGKSGKAARIKERQHGRDKAGGGASTKKKTPSASADAPEANTES